MVCWNRSVNIFVTGITKGSTINDLGEPEEKSKMNLFFSMGMPFGKKNFLTLPPLSVVRQNPTLPTTSVGRENPTLPRNYLEMAAIARQTWVWSSFGFRSYHFSQGPVRNLKRPFCKARLIYTPSRRLTRMIPGPTRSLHFSPYECNLLYKTGYYHPHSKVRVKLIFRPSTQNDRDWPGG